MIFFIHVAFLVAARAGGVALGRTASLVGRGIGRSATVGARTVRAANLFQSGVRVSLFGEQALRNPVTDFLDPRLDAQGFLGGPSVGGRRAAPHGSVPFGNVLVQDFATRLVQTGWGWTRPKLRRFLSDPNRYEKPVRFAGGVETINGRKFNWSPGYLPYMSIQFRRPRTVDVDLTPGFRWRFSRPFPPELTNETLDALQEQFVDWVAVGKSPR